MYNDAPRCGVSQEFLRLDCKVNGFGVNIFYFISHEKGLGRSQMASPQKLMAFKKYGGYLLGLHHIIYSDPA